MIISFWIGGGDAYDEGLEEQYETQLADLRKQLDECENYSQQLMVEEQIEAVEVEYKAKLQGNDWWLLF